jgi:hypothetical protein
MDLDGLEPRRTLWAVGEVWWEDATGIPCRVPATIEDTSVSGACVRVKTAIEVGSNLTVKWHRGEFAGVARNRRRDGGEFLVGIQRQNPARGGPSKKTDMPSAPDVSRLFFPTISASALAATMTTRLPARLAAEIPASILPAPLTAVESEPPSAKVTTTTETPANALEEEAKPAAGPDVPPLSRSTIEESDTSAQLAISVPASPNAASGPASRAEGSSVRHEGRVMESTPLFRKLWRHQPEGANQSENAPRAEVAVSKPDIATPESVPGPQSVLLACEDIYRAAGILGAGSKYDIAKIVEMVGSKHIRELPREVKRASVLMALDAAGIPVDEVLNDAARRIHALNSYESGQQKQFEQFEAAKLRENAQIKLEIERLTAHYAQRIQQNLDLVARENATFHNWQSLKEAESQRIAEAVALCGKQPLVECPAGPPVTLVKAAAASQGDSAEHLKAPAKTDA